MISVAPIFGPSIIEKQEDGSCLARAAIAAAGAAVVTKSSLKVGNLYSTFHFHLIPQFWLLTESAF